MSREESTLGHGGQGVTCMDWVERAQKAEAELQRLRGAEDGRYELVRVSREMVEHLLTQDPQPVVLVGIERFQDGSVELVFRTSERSANGGSDA